MKTIPGGREGIEDKRYAEAEKQAARAAAAVDREAALITAAAQILEQGTRWFTACQKRSAAVSKPLARAAASASPKAVSGS